MATLQLAVPLWIDRLSRLPWSDVMARARECGDVVAQKGDVLQFRSKKKGETARSFNALAEGLACLSFAQGGVRFNGAHWEARHPELTYPAEEPTA